jgi:hypothetical protein
LAALALVAIFAALLIIMTNVTHVKTAFGNQTPIASFAYSPTTPMPEETITFDASSSYDPDGSIMKYTWDFGDGIVTTVTNPVITHAYPVDGNYTVQLTVTDNGQATSVSVAVVQVSTVTFFRVVYTGTVIPMANVKVTVYYYSGSAWVKARVGPNDMEIKYDNMTQPELANTAEERFRNPGYTASILRCGSSNIGFDLHPATWKVFYKFEWGSYVAYWPNNPSRVYSYKDGAVLTHDYAPCHQAYYDASAGTYVIKVNNIPKDGVAPTESHPIIVPMCPPSTSKYYLTVRTDPAGITTILGEGWYNKDTNVVLTAPTYVNVSSSFRYRFSYWDVDGTSKGSGVNPITVCMNANHTATAHYVRQYAVTFAQTGLSSDATGTVVTADGSAKTLSQLPFTKWVDSGSTVTYSYTTPVSSSISGKRYRLNGVSGPSSPITVNAAANVTGNYVTQCQVTFAQTGLDSSATGTVVTINGAPKTYSSLPYVDWFDYGCTITYSYNSPVSSSTLGKRFRLDSVSGPPTPITATSSTTVTGNYVTQCQVTFAQTGLDSSATGTVVTINGDAKQYSELPANIWVDNDGSVTYTYNNIVLSTTFGKQFKLLSVTGPISPITVTSSATVIGNYKTQHRVTFDQTGAGSDFTGTVVTIDSINYGISSLPVSFWWDSSSSHSFSYSSPLTVNASKQYVWQSTSGLTTLQSGTLTITTSGSVTGNYIVANRITFDQVGASLDFTGTVVVIDGTPYGAGSLPISFTWSVGSTHSFSFQSPLVVGANAKQYVWTGTTGLSTLQGSTITVSTYGNIIAHYKTQYYLALNTYPSGIGSPSGGGWYDSGAYASISTDQYLPGGSRYRFDSWTTQDMSEITDPSSPSTTVLMDKAKTVTANYVHQYQVTFNHSGVGTDFTGTVVSIDSINYRVGDLPVSFWWDSGSAHTFAFYSPLIVDPSKQYDWSSTTGLSTLQAGTLTTSADGSVTGNYVVHNKYQITFSQIGVSSDFGGTVVIIDGVNYGVADLPHSFWWDSGSAHTFAFASPLNVDSNKRYVWTGTTGLSTLQSDTITASSSGSVTGNYKTQYYLTLSTNPSGVTLPTGADWYDAGTYATISTDAFVDIIVGSSRYRFNGWTTGDMAEITDPTRSPTTVLMDKGKTVTANYAIQYNVTFTVSGVNMDFTGPVLTIDGRDYYVSDMPMSFWWDSASTHEFEYISPLNVNSGKRYLWTSTTGLTPLRSGTLAVTASGSITGNYKTQYYLTVTSPNGYGSPTPASGWFDSGSSITSSVASPWPSSMGTRYVCIGWTGTGSVPPSGSGSSVTFTITSQSSITWNWKTQYLLKVRIDPSGLSPQPTRNSAGETEPSGGWWYDSGTSVTLTAQTVTNYTFANWDVDGTPKGSGVNPISVTMNAQHIATAHYNPIHPPLSVSITPPSASIALGESVFFSSTVGDGTSPYTYQWHVNGNPVLGATSSTWTFTPAANGTYLVYLKVTDHDGNTVQSSTSTVYVGVGPVGGYTLPLVQKEAKTPLLCYALSLAIFAVAISLIRRKRK